MRKVVLVAAALASALALGGCGNTSSERAAGGALLGGAAGAIIGGAATGKVGGAVAGGVIGAVGGAVIGGVTAPQEQGARCLRYGYDYDGNQVCTRYSQY